MSKSDPMIRSIMSKISKAFDSQNIPLVTNPIKKKFFNINMRRYGKKNTWKKLKKDVLEPNWTFYKYSCDEDLWWDIRNVRSVKVFNKNQAY